MNVQADKVLAQMQQIVASQAMELAVARAQVAALQAQLATANEGKVGDDNEKESTKSDEAV